MTKSKASGLGKGLGALLKASNITTNSQLSNNLNSDNKLNIVYIKLDTIIVGKYQPRRVFDNQDIEDLANSIKLNGVIQPIVVRPIADKFEIVAGERRYRAAKVANLQEIPAIVRQLDDEDTLAIALIENIQRKDLNPIEEAIAYKKLIEEFDLIQDELATIVAKSRSYIANIVRLLNLDEAVQNMLIENKLTMGHARALLTLDKKKQIEFANLIYAKGLTTKSIEQMVNNIKNNNNKTIKSQPKQVEITELENQLADNLGMDVQIKHKTNGAGKITINYSSLDEIDLLLKRIL
jgi:ParB family chromosome partitioning protein